MACLGDGLSRGRLRRMAAAQSDVVVGVLDRAAALYIIDEPAPLLSKTARRHPTGHAALDRTRSESNAARADGTIGPRPLGLLFVVTRTALSGLSARVAGRRRRLGDRGETCLVTHRGKPCLCLAEERSGPLEVAAQHRDLREPDDRVSDPPLAPRLAQHRERLRRAPHRHRRPAAREREVGGSPERARKPPAVARTPEERRGPRRAAAPPARSRRRRCRSARGRRAPCRCRAARSAPRGARARARGSPARLGRSPAASSR